MVLCRVCMFGPDGRHAADAIEADRAADQNGRVDDLLGHRRASTVRIAFICNNNEKREKVLFAVLYQLWMA